MAAGVKVPRQRDLVARLGAKPSEWGGRCHAVSIAVVEEMAKVGQEAVVRRGWFRGETRPGARFHGRPCQHSWVELPDGRVLDPTRFAFVGGPAWPLWIGPDTDYDIAGCRWASPAAPPPDPYDFTNFRGEEMDPVELNIASVDYVVDLLGAPGESFGVDDDDPSENWILLTQKQLFWLANLPIKDREAPGVLSRLFAVEVFEAIVNADRGEAIPIDRRDWILGDGGAGYGRKAA